MDDDDGPIMNVAVNPLFKMTMNLKKRLSSGSLPTQTSEAHSRARKNWKSALVNLNEREDPWAVFHWDELKVENAIRHKYNALTKKWKKEAVIVKMEEDSFGKGAMRECYRM